MKKLLPLLILLASTLISSNIHAEKGPSWNFIGASYLEVDIDGISEVSPTGFGLSASTLVTDNVILFANLSGVSESFMGVDVDLDNTYFGVGYRFAVSDTSDFAVGAGYTGVELCADTVGCVDDNGFLILADFRTKLTPSVELSLNANYVDIDGESETGASASLSYYFNDSFSAGVGVATADDVDTLSLSVRLHF